MVVLSALWVVDYSFAEWVKGAVMCRHPDSARQSRPVPLLLQCNRSALLCQASRTIALIWRVAYGQDSPATPPYRWGPTVFGWGIRLVGRVRIRQPHLVSAAA